MTDRELLQQALDALRLCTALPTWPSITPVIEALRARLSQCERCGEINPAEIHTCSPQEPVAWFCKLPDNKISIKIVGKPTEGNWEPLYTAPPQREWQGLTDEEVGMLTVFDGLHHVEVPLLADFARAIEAKLKEKNNG